MHPLRLVATLGKNKTSENAKHLVAKMLTP